MSEIDTTTAPVATDGAAVTSTDVAQPDLSSFVAELDAHEGDAAPSVEASPPADGAAPAETEGKPEAEAKEAPAASETPAEARARKILAAANRKERKALETVKRSQDELAQGLRTAPLATLRKLGTSIDEFLAAAQAEGEPATAQAPTADDRVKALEERERQRELAQSEAQFSAAKAAVIDSVKQAADKFPRINRSGSHELVTDWMIAYHAKYGVRLEAEKAAQQVEEYLASLAADSAPTPSAPKQAARKEAPQQQRPGTVTLTNTDTRNVPASQDELPMDSDARYRSVLKELGLN